MRGAVIPITCPRDEKYPSFKGDKDANFHNGEVLCHPCMVTGIFKSKNIQAGVSENGVVGSLEL